MLKKTITYTDYNGTERTEDFYFNLSKAEFMDLEFSEKGGLAHKLQEVYINNDEQAMYQFFKKIILSAYGEKSEDGRRFMKSPEITEAFYQTEAYVELFMSFTASENALMEFLLGTIPKEYSDELGKLDLSDPKVVDIVLKQNEKTKEEK